MFIHCLRRRDTKESIVFEKMLPVDDNVCSLSDIYNISHWFDSHFLFMIRFGQCSVIVTLSCHTTGA